MFHFRIGRRIVYEPIEDLDNSDSWPKRHGSSIRVLVLVFISLSIFLSYRRFSHGEVIDLSRTAGYKKCIPGKFSSLDQLPFSIWTTEHGIRLPIYSTGNIDAFNQYNYTSAVIIQHGFQRNGNDYFCAGNSALYKVSQERFSMIIKYESSLFYDNQICVFLSTGDLRIMKTQL